MCVKQTLIERVHADRNRGWENGSRVSWEKDVVPLVDAYDVLRAEVEYLRGERAAVVAWLHAPCGSPGHEDRFCAYCNVRRNIGDEIERGEHRREEER